MRLKKTRMAPFLATVSIAALAIAGCGGDSTPETDSAEVEAATAAATVTFNALKQGNPKAICRSFSPEYVERQMESVGKCTKGLGKLLKGASGALKGTSLGDVTVDGDRGVAEMVKKDGSGQGKIFLVRDDGDWYSTLEAAPASEDK